jgi:hypothetical protein
VVATVKTTVIDHGGDEDRRRELAGLLDPDERHPDVEVEGAGDGADEPD